jgi:ribosomal protein S18 acetylase RimI-like enzyme
VIGTDSFTPLGSEDRAAAVALWRAAELTRPWNDPEADFNRALAGSHAAILGARQAGALAATIMVGEDGHRGWFYYLTVDPAWRRRGLGRAAVKAAEAWLRARGVPKAQLMIRGDNDEARAFYAALGYEVGDVTVVGRWLDR